MAQISKNKLKSAIPKRPSSSTTIVCISSTFSRVMEKENPLELEAVPIARVDEVHSLLDTRVSYQTVHARATRIASLDEVHTSFLRTSSGLLFNGDAELPTRSAATSSALTMGYGFGASIDPERVGFLARAPPRGGTLGALVDAMPCAEHLPQPVAELVARCRDEPLGSATTETVLAGVVKMVADGDMTSTLVRADAFEVTRCCGAEVYDTGAIVDGDGVMTGRVTAFDGGKFAHVQFTESYNQFTESYNQSVGDMKRMLDLVRATVRERRAAAAETEDAATEPAAAVEAKEGDGEEPNDADNDAEDGNNAEDEEDEFRVTGLERTCAAAAAADIRVGFWPHGWYPVQAKLNIASSHELMVALDDGGVWSVRVADGARGDELVREMLSVLLLLDATLGMKSATDRVVLAVACPVSHAGTTARRLRSFYIALTPDQEGLDWAAIDHVIRVAPDGEDNLALTYIAKDANYAELEKVVMGSSPRHCIGAAAALVGAAAAFLNTEFDLITVLMIVLPLLLQHELVEPWKLWQLCRLASRWHATRDAAPGGLFAFIDIRFDRQHCGAVMAFLLGMPEFLAGGGRIVVCCVAPVTAVVLWLVVLAAMYSRIQRIAAGRILRHYSGKCTHGRHTGLLGGYIIGSSTMDSQCPGGSYNWVPNASTLTQDAGYGCILCA